MFVLRLYFCYYNFFCNFKIISKYRVLKSKWEIHISILELALSCYPTHPKKTKELVGYNILTQTQTDQRKSKGNL